MAWPCQGCSLPQQRARLAVRLPGLPTQPPGQTRVEGYLLREAQGLGQEAPGSSLVPGQKQAGLREAGLHTSPSLKLPRRGLRPRSGARALRSAALCQTCHPQHPLTHCCRWDTEVQCEKLG